MVSVKQLFDLGYIVNKKNNNGELSLQLTLFLNSLFTEN